MSNALYTFIAIFNCIWHNILINFFFSENIMLGRPTIQENSYASSFNSKKAVDGSIETFSKVQEREHSVWWRVRLKRYQAITDINITMDTGTVRSTIWVDALQWQHCIFKFF